MALEETLAEAKARLEQERDEAREAARLFFHWLEAECKGITYRTAPYLARFPWLKERDDKP